MVVEKKLVPYALQADLNRVVFVIMVISSLAFYVMAFRVPVVSIVILPRQRLS